MTTAREFTYLVIPAGTVVARSCQACDTWLYFVELPNGKRMPVDAEATEQCHHPTATEDGMGVSHFQTCTDPDRFSRPRRSAR